MDFLVTKNAVKPGREDGTCFYCKQAIGQPHKADCVSISKRVKVRAVIEYEVVVPNAWNAANVEFHRNESSWCCNNMIEELQQLISDDTCLCDKDCVHFTYVEDVSGAFLNES